MCTQDEAGGEATQAGTQVLADALDSAIRDAFQNLLNEPVPPDLEALVARIRSLEGLAQASLADDASAGK